MRDPRTDPRPGDVLRTGRERTVIAVGSHELIYQSCEATWSTSLDTWLACMRSAKIVKAGKDG